MVMTASMRCRVDGVEAGGTPSGRRRARIEFGAVRTASTETRRAGNVYGPPLGTNLVVFIDDLNMPRVDTYGTQQPITLLLTLISRGFIYDREKDLTQKILKDMTYIGAMGPPGGGRNNVDPRFVALFSVFNLPDPTNDVLKHMYSSIINERLRDFSPSVKDAAAKFPDAMLELFSYILESPYPRLAISPSRPSERPKRGHDLLHMDETVSRELKPNLNFTQACRRRRRSSTTFSICAICRA